MNKIIDDFIALKISARKFVDEVFSDEDLYRELNSYMPTIEEVQDEKWKDFKYTLSIKTHHYDLKRIYKYACSIGANPSGRCRMYDFTYELLKFNGINLAYNKYYLDRAILLMDVIPAYVGGPEAEEYIDSFIDNLDSSLSEQNKKKAIKEMIKTDFKCEGKAKPRWIQEPEWPVTEKPLCFLSKKKDGDKFTFSFKDEATGEIKQIIQYA